MPLYEYECEACGHRFEVIQKFSDPPVAPARKCSGVVEKLFSSPAIQFKGSGFYLTDYGRGGKSDTAPTATSGGKSDSAKGEASVGEQERVEDRVEVRHRSPNQSRRRSGERSPTQDRVEAVHVLSRLIRRTHLRSTIPEPTRSADRRDSCYPP